MASYLWKTNWYIPIPICLTLTQLWLKFSVCNPPRIAHLLLSTAVDCAFCVALRGGVCLLYLFLVQIWAFNERLTEDLKPRLKCHLKCSGLFSHNSRTWFKLRRLGHFHVARVSFACINAFVPRKKGLDKLILTGLSALCRLMPPSSSQSIVTIETSLTPDVLYNECLIYVISPLTIIPAYVQNALKVLFSQVLILVSLRNG